MTTTVFHASTTCLTGRHHLIPPLVTRGRVGRITTHPDAHRFLLVCASLSVAHAFAAEFLTEPYRIYEVVIDGPPPLDAKVWCAPFARVVAQVFPCPVPSPLRYQTSLRSAVRLLQAQPPLPEASGPLLHGPVGTGRPGANFSPVTVSLARRPAHLPGMNENGADAHIALAPADMYRVTAKARRDAFQAADAAQPALFERPVPPAPRALRSPAHAQRVGALISAAKRGFYPGSVLVG